MAFNMPPADRADDPHRANRAYLESQVKMRLQDARRQKAPFEYDMREGYVFAAPHRSITVNSTSPKPVGKIYDTPQVNTSFAYELCGDFPTVIINTFFPQNEQWLVRRASSIVPPEMVQQVEIMAAQADDTVFKSILASNLYAECGKAFNPDLALGTVGLWIEHEKSWEPPKVQCVPIRELEINIGPDGQIDDRFVVRHTKFRYLQAILGDIEIPREVREKGQKDDKKNCIVVWSFWRIYDDPGTEKWKHCVTVDGYLAHEAELKGQGSCPLVVARFNATPDWAWGVGPLIQSLPDLRIIDELAGMKVRNVDFALSPPISFPDTSFANISDGIESGMAYAVRPGEEGAIKNLYQYPSIDPAIYMTQEIETRIKRLFFLDWPQQDGKTPPTATQWLDEMTLAQRRIGTPGLVFWQEFCAGVFMRFLYLLEKAGQVEKIAIPTKGGTKRPVAMMPYNPAQRSAEQEQVALFSRFVQIGASAFPEEWKLVTDGQKTLQNVANKMGVNAMWAKRDPAKVAGALAQIQQLQNGTQATGPAMAQGQPMPGATAGPAQSPVPQYQIKSGNV
jgi:Bacteriophage head to tail connecting protein